MSGTRKIGDWKKVERIIGNLAKEMENAREESLKKWGLKAEGIAVKHINSQDLNWAPLKPATISTKIRKGYSTNILVATSDYFQAITSWADKDSTYAGVKKKVKDGDNNVVADIAKVHEFGSSAGNIPARPLWKPTFKDTMDWFKDSNSTPAKIFKKNMRKYG